MASERVQRRIERLLDQAEEAIDRSDWESLRGYAQAILGLDADNKDAIAFLTSPDRLANREMRVLAKGGS